MSRGSICTYIRGMGSQTRVGEVFWFGRQLGVVVIIKPETVDLQHSASSG